MVTWNPQLMEVKAEPGATEVFDSSKIPGEIIDLMVVNTETLKDNPDLGKALVGIWYETMRADARSPATKGKAAREAMAKLSGTDLAGFDAQLDDDAACSTRRATRVAFTKSADLARPWTSCAPSASSTTCSARGVKSQGRDRHRVARRQDARARRPT